ncbi:hypothetical protein ACA910_021497 [Epithemia clementina (nom. ined.)]
MSRAEEIFRARRRKAWGFDEQSLQRTQQVAADSSSFASPRAPGSGSAALGIDNIHNNTGGDGGGLADWANKAALLGISILIGFGFRTMQDWQTTIHGKWKTACHELQDEITGSTNCAVVTVLLPTPTTRSTVVRSSKNSSNTDAKDEDANNNVEKMQDFIQQAFWQHKIRITGQGQLLVKDLFVKDVHNYVDSQYKAIADRSWYWKPDRIQLSAQEQEGFLEAFGESWNAALEQGRIVNAKQMTMKMREQQEQQQQPSASTVATLEEQLDKLWSRCRKAKKDVISLQDQEGEKFHVGRIIGQSSKKYDNYQNDKVVYVINGYYPYMRATYWDPSYTIQWYTVKWPADALSWRDFRAKIVHSINQQVEEKVGSYITDISLSKKKKQKKNDDKNKKRGAGPSETLNPTEKIGCPGARRSLVHASASPLHALTERVHWLGTTVEDDSFGKALLATGAVKPKVLSKWILHRDDEEVEVTLLPRSPPPRRQSEIEGRDEETTNNADGTTKQTNVSKTDATDKPQKVSILDLLYDVDTNTALRMVRKDIRTERRLFSR